MSAFYWYNYFRVKISSLKTRKPYPNLTVFNNFHYEAKLCISCIVSGFRNKDAPFVLLLFFPSLWSFRQNFNMFKDLSLESRNIQTENCAPIQCTVWPRNVEVEDLLKKQLQHTTFLKSGFCSNFWNKWCFDRKTVKKHKSKLRQLSP